MCDTFRQTLTWAFSSGCHAPLPIEVRSMNNRTDRWEHT
jgi:hypothetical protein